jgi:hypothetical protein
MIDTIANFLFNVGSKTWSTAGSSDRSPKTLVKLRNGCALCCRSVPHSGHLNVAMKVKVEMKNGIWFIVDIMDAECSCLVKSAQLIPTPSTGRVVANF